MQFQISTAIAAAPAAPAAPRGKRDIGKRGISP
jgi:hypothetical protein